MDDEKRERYNANKRKYYKNNKDKYLESNKKYHEKNPSYSNDYYAKNREKICQRNRDRYAKNKLEQIGTTIYVNGKKYNFKKTEDGIIYTGPEDVYMFIYEDGIWKVFETEEEYAKHLLCRGSNEG